MNVVPEPSERRTTVISSSGSLSAGIEIRDRLVVPFLDLAEVDVGEQRARELDRARRDAFDVHDRHDAADDRRKLHEAGRLQILGLQRHVGRAEVDGLGLDLRDAAARADRLVVHADVGLLLVRLRPLGVDGIRKRRAGAGDVDCRRRWKCRTRSSRRPGSLGSSICALRVFLVSTEPVDCGRGRVTAR